MTTRTDEAIERYIDGNGADCERYARQHGIPLHYAAMELMDEDDAINAEQVAEDARDEAERRADEAYELECDAHAHAEFCRNAYGDLD